MNMKKISIFASAVLLTCLVVNGQEPEKWVLLENTDLGFSVSFPGQPTASTQEVPSDVGTLKMSMWQLDCSDSPGFHNLLYMVNYTEYPASLLEGVTNTDDFFTGSLNGMAANINGTIKEVKTIKVGDLEGRQAEIAMPGEEVVLTSVLVLKGNRFYMLMIFTEVASKPNSDMTKFFESLRLL
jgi:hypothetical protein